jgi:Domain of unknown function (DUF4345)
MSHRFLIATLAALGAVPVLTGIVGIVGGLQFSPEAGASTYLDSEYRFLNVCWAAAGGALWWSLRRPADRAAVTRAVLTVMVLGGLARLVGAVLTGLPPVPFRISMAIELILIPALLVWHRRAFRHAPAAT